MMIYDKNGNKNDNYNDIKWNIFAMKLKFTSLRDFWVLKNSVKCIKVDKN